MWRSCTERFAFYFRRKVSFGVQKTKQNPPMLPDKESDLILVECLDCSQWEIWGISLGESFRTEQNQTNDNELNRASIRRQ